jgi:hypothetical protein
MIAITIEGKTRSDIGKKNTNALRNRMFVQHGGKEK